MSGRLLLNYRTRSCGACIPRAAGVKSHRGFSRLGESSCIWDFRSRRSCRFPGCSFTVRIQVGVFVWLHVNERGPRLSRTTYFGSICRSHLTKSIPKAFLPFFFPLRVNVTYLTTISTMSKCRRQDGEGWLESIFSPVWCLLLRLLKEVQMVSPSPRSAV